MEINHEDFHEWKESPVTQYFFSLIRKQTIGLMKDIGEGKTYNGTSVEQTALETARAFGAIEALESVLDIEFEEEENARSSR